MGCVGKYVFVLELELHDVPMVIAWVCARNYRRAFITLLVDMGLFSWKKNIISLFGYFRQKLKINL